MSDSTALEDNTLRMSTFAYALLENYEVFGKTETEYEIGTRDKLIQYIGGLEHDLTNKEIEYTDLWDDALAFQARIAELEAAQRWIPVSERLPKESGWYRVGAINVFYEGYTDEVYFDANKTKSGWQSSVRDEIYCWLDGVPELPKPPEVQE